MTTLPGSSAESWPGSCSDFYEFERFDFSIDDMACSVVRPKASAPGKPWVWRARFFGTEPQADIALLNNGFHLAYISVANLYGNTEAVRRWDRFYRYLTTVHGLDRNVVLEGFSRGGLIVYNWAIKNAESVQCIYADAPVCDIRSWPGGKMAGMGSPADWERCLDAYGLTETEVLTFNGNPVDNLAPLAKANIPIIHVVGDKDRVVPVAENTAIVEARYRSLGGTIEVIHKPDCSHHPHSLEDPTPIVSFILASY